MELTHGSLFTGIGGFDLGFEDAGFRTLYQAEFDPTPTSETNPNPRPLEQQWNHRVLAKRFPGVPNYGDINRIDGAQLPAVTVLTFGSPCQDLSVAGARAGIEGARSGLFFEAARIIEQCRPTIAIWENVPGAFSSNAGRDFLVVIDTLAQLGATDIAWRVFDSRYAGVPQRRRRLYLVADFGGRRAGAILFETARCPGHPAAVGEERESLAATLAAGAAGAGRPGGSHDTDLVAPTLLGGGSTPAAHHKRSGSDRILVVTEAERDYSDPVTSKWAKQSGGPAGDEIQNLAPLVANRRGGFGWSETDDGQSPTLRNGGETHQGGIDTPMAIIQDARNMANKGQNGSGISEGDVAYTLDVMSTQAVAFEPRIARGKGGRVEDVSPALTADSDRGDGQPMVFQERGREGGQSLEASDEPLSYALTNPGRGGRSNTKMVATGPRIRRFTPTETERLQGFPVGWTCLCGAEADMFACTCPDGPRYRATGNAVTRNVASWIAHRTRAALEGLLEA